MVNVTSASCGVTPQDMGLLSRLCEDAGILINSNHPLWEA